MQKSNNNTRRDFLKTIPVAIASIGAISIFKFKKSTPSFERKFKTLSKSEADEIIKNEKFPVAIKLDPAPAPLKGENGIG